MEIGDFVGGLLAIVIMIFTMVLQALPFVIAIFIVHALFW